MRFLVNLSLHPDKSRAEFVQQHGYLSDEAWELMRTGILRDGMFKIGERPGFAALCDADGMQEIQTMLDTVPAVREGWFQIEIEPLSRVMNFD
jgi:hypothetical protein